MVAIDVLQLIDKLEQLVSSGARVPLTNRSIVDEQDVLDIIDQLRIAVPEEIRQAKRMSQERERVLQQAQAEAEKVLDSAREQATLLLQETEVVRAAEDFALDRRRQAEQDAEDVRRGADDYAFEVLNSLENELMKLLATVRKGKATLERSVTEPSNNSFVEQ